MRYLTKKEWRALPFRCKYSERSAVTTESGTRRWEYRRWITQTDPETDAEVWEPVTLVEGEIERVNRLAEDKQAALRAEYENKLPSSSDPIIREFDKWLEGLSVARSQGRSIPASTVFSKANQLRAAVVARLSINEMD